MLERKRAVEFNRACVRSSVSLMITQLFELRYIRDCNGVPTAKTRYLDSSVAFFGLALPKDVIASRLIAKVAMTKKSFNFDAAGFRLHRGWLANLQQRYVV
jgi:hypothetical protein